jgi:hypothetical protein
MPRGFLVEDGPRPEFAELYGAHELDTASGAIHPNGARGNAWLNCVNHPDPLWRGAP